MIEDNLALHIPDSILPTYEHELPLYEASRLNLLYEDNLVTDASFVAFNQGEGYGLLREMDLEDRPNSRDVAIYQALPNELPRVAGIITTVRQTPLSHVNLRAVQNGVPNAYIRDALQQPDIAALVGRFVRYEVTDSEWTLRAATPAEVNEHYESSRPAQDQTPQRDLAVTSIRPLSDVRFGDWSAFGVKAANVAELGRLGFPEGTVPDGFAIPFYFYDEFMKAHGFHERIEQMLADADFQTDFDVQDEMLDDLRDDIEDADSPQWIVDALTEMHASFPREPRCATGRAPTTKTCRGSTAPDCTTPRLRIPRRPRRTASTNRSRECLPASGPSARSASASSIALTTASPRWAFWCIRTIPTSWPTALPSASTRSMAAPADTTSTPRSARIWLPTR